MEAIESPKLEQQLQEPELRIIEVTHSPRGNRLRNPLKIQLPKPESPSDRIVYEYVINAFSWKMSALIPFAFQNNTVLELAKHLKRHTTGSSATLYQYVYGIHRFSKWLKRCPNTMIEESRENPNKYVRLVDDFAGNLQAENLAPGTIANHVKGVRALFRANGISLDLPYRLPRRVKYRDRAPTPEELSKILDLGDIREKVIVSLFALGGFRVGTLTKLQYQHVRRDLEKGTVPVHIHVEAEITKGKYHEYDTFVGPEAVEYLNAYFEMRKKGTRKLPPEILVDETPIIRAEHAKEIRSITPGNVHRLVHDLYIKTGLIQKRSKRRYELRAHSIRKFFRTQLGSLSTIPTDYIEYMMGHTISTYNDVKMKGIEFLRNLYASSGLSIRPKKKISKIEQLKLIIEAWGLNPNEILSREALSSPHRTQVDRQDTEIQILNQALKQAIVKELQKPQQGIFESG